MANNKIVRTYAMQYGTYMGLFWIAKFAFFPLGLTILPLGWLFLILTLCVPVLQYMFVRRFREQQCNGKFSFINAFNLCILITIYASLLAAVAHYIYFAFIDGGYLFRTYEQLLTQLSEMDQMKGFAAQMTEMLNQLNSLSSIDITMQLFSQNITYGLLLALPIALLTMRNKKKL